MSKMRTKLEVFQKFVYVKTGRLELKPNFVCKENSNMDAYSASLTGLSPAVYAQKEKKKRRDKEEKKKGEQERARMLHAKKTNAGHSLFTYVSSTKRNSVVADEDSEDEEEEEDYDLEIDESLLLPSQLFRLMTSGEREDTGRENKSFSKDDYAEGDSDSEVNKAVG